MKTIDVDDLKEELAELGISIDFIEKKHVRNLYMAKRIIEGYDFERDLSKKEKRVLIHSVLNNVTLDEDSSTGCYLSTLIENLRQIGLDEQQIYGTIINLGVNRTVLEEPGYAYTSMLSNAHNSCKTIIQYKDKIEKRVSSMTILTALANNLNEQEEQELKEELEELGISRYFIEYKHVSNLYMAKRIVEGYDFKRELTQQEKRALIQAILDNSRLDKKRRYIYKLMHIFEKIGLDEQEIFGTIINLGVNGAVVEEKGYGYSDLLNAGGDLFQTLIEYKDKIDKRVSPITILAALASNLDEQELEEELEELGISSDFIKQKHVSNVYIAKRIVEGYDFGRELTQQEKRALIQAIVNNSELHQKGIYIYILMQRFEKIGLNEQEIYGAIINLGVNRVIVKERIRIFIWGAVVK